MLIYIHNFVNFIDMAKNRHFLNLVLAHFDLPLPEPLRSEAEEYFFYTDRGRYELVDLELKSLKNRGVFDSGITPKFLNTTDAARWYELKPLGIRYGGKDYYFETEDDGYDDEMIMRCIRNIRDEDSFKLDERQRQIAIELLELELFEIERKERVWEMDITPYLRKFALHELHISLDKEKRLKRRYLEMKYGRRERLRKEREEEERKRRSRIAACLGPGFTIDW